MEQSNQEIVNNISETVLDDESKKILEMAEILKDNEEKKQLYWKSLTTETSVYKDSDDLIKKKAKVFDNLYLEMCMKNPNVTIKDSRELTELEIINIELQISNLIIEGCDFRKMIESIKLNPHIEKKWNEFLMIWRLSMNEGNSNG